MCFGQFLCPLSGVFHGIHSNGICHTGLLTACKLDQDVPSWSCSQAVSKPVWHIPLLCVQWKISYDGQRNCPKHVEFHSKNKFEKFHPDPARKLSANLYDIYHCCVYSEKLLMMDRETVRNMYSFIPRINLRNSILILLTSCQQTCMTYTIAVCTVKNSWWWTEELSKTCRLSFRE